ncbi:MAG: helix-turn-helix transcriptional regulator [Planctomycetota bacterium]
MKSSRISRVVRILTALQAGNCTVDDLAGMSRTSRRTVFRDLKELRSIGVPYHYNATTGDYTIDPEFFLPPINLNLQEALSLLLLTHKAVNQIQLPFKNSAVMAILKIENNLPVKIKQYCNATLKNVSVVGNAQAKMNVFDETFAQLQKAITKKYKVNMRYHSLFDKKTIDVELCPYHLMYNHRAWYVLGLSAMHNSIRTFKLNRIRELKVLGKRFLDGDDFDLQEYLGRAWVMIPQGQIYNIKLRFLPKVAANVTEVNWHSTQEVTRNSDGSATVKFRVDGLGEIIWWILGYGDQVQVLAPKKLREKVLEVAGNIIKLNKKI